MDYWVGDVKVVLKVKPFRVGGAQEDVDLGSIPLKHVGSSIKGILRKSAKKMANSLGIKGLDKDIFGDENREGKIQILLESSEDSEKEKVARYGIKLEPRLGSVKHGHLFSYSFLTIEEIQFIIRPISKLTKEEARFLLQSLNYLRYESLGSFGSRGLGLIEDVHVDEKFRRFAEEGV